MHRLDPPSKKRKGDSKQVRGKGEGAFSPLLYRIAQKMDFDKPKVKSEKKKGFRNISDLTDDDFLGIRYLHEICGIKQKRIAYLSGIDYKTVTSVCTYSTRTHITCGSSAPPSEKWAAIAEAEITIREELKSFIDNNKKSVSAGFYYKAIHDFNSLKTETLLKECEKAGFKPSLAPHQSNTP